MNQIPDPDHSESENTTNSSTLVELVEYFNDLVGDDITHDAAVTIAIFTNLLNDVRNRKQRGFINFKKVSEYQPRQQRRRNITPPPTYSNVRIPKIVKFTQSAESQ